MDSLNPPPFRRDRILTVGGQQQHQQAPWRALSTSAAATAPGGPSRQPQAQRSRQRRSPPASGAIAPISSSRGFASLSVGGGSACPTAAELRKTLGAPIPLNEHAVSVTMPKWSHVVGYEEGDPSVTDKLVLGYPRFVYHPFVKQLVEVRFSSRDVCVNLYTHLCTLAHTPSPSPQHPPTPTNHRRCGSSRRWRRARWARTRWWARCPSPPWRQPSGMWVGRSVAVFVYE